MRKDEMRRSEERSSINGQRRMSWGMRTLAVMILMAAGSRDAVAQLPPRPGVAQELRSELRSREPRDRRLESALKDAEKAVQEDPEKAIDLVQLILETPEDAPLPGKKSYSLKDCAEDLIRENETLSVSYERRFGAAARTLLEDAARAESFEAFRDIARRYAMTDAGAEALWRLALAMFDGGDAATTGRWCDRLERHLARQRFEPRLTLLSAWAARAGGHPEDAVQRLGALREKSPDGLRLGDQTIPWFQADDQAGLWMDTWLSSAGTIEPANGLPSWGLLYGDGRRNGPSPEAPPVWDSGWTYPLVDIYDEPRRPSNIDLMTRLSEDLSSKNFASSKPLLPVASPLVVGNRVIFSGYGSIKSVDLDSGELDWSTVPVDDTLLQLWSEDDPAIVPALIERFLAQRVLRDHVSCAISTDGRMVYRVAQSGLVGSMMPGVGVARMADPFTTRNDNRLQAYHINGGKLEWDVGGPSRDLNAAFPRAADPSDLAGTFFCGAPLPWKGELLCVVEQSNQLRVLSLDPKNGVLLWSQTLSNLDQQIAGSPDRRFGSVVPALDGSTLVATSGDGAIVAFDVAQRRCMWSYTYRAAKLLDPQMQAIMQINRRAMRQSTIDSMLSYDGWLDPRTLIVQGKVIATPMDDGRLHCVDLATGKALWTSTRNDDLFVAGVADDVIVVFGGSEVRALQAQDGSIAWKLAIPEPSGRGARIGDRYTFPTTSSEVVTIDLARGQILARSALSSGKAAGNLVAAPGVFVTQTPSEIRVFRSGASISTEIENRLAQNAADPLALALRGETRLHRGEVQEGEQDLVSAASSADARVKQTLAWSLVGGLARDFSRYSGRIEEIQSLTLDPDVRSQAWQNYSRGLEQQGDFVGALIAMLRSAEEMGETADRMIDREGSLRVRNSRLLQGRAIDLWGRLETDAQLAAVELIRTRLERPESDPVAVDRALAVLPLEAIPEDVQLARAERGSLPVIEQEHILLRLRQSQDPTIVAKATLQLVRIALADPKGPFPHGLISDLSGRLANVDVGADQTAAEALQAAMDSPDFTQRIAAQQWPAGRMLVAPAQETGAVPEYQAPLSFTDRNELLAGWTFALDSSMNGLSVSDDMGVFRWKEPMGSRDGVLIDPQLSAHGRLVLIEMPESFRILDATTGQTLRQIELWGQLPIEYQQRFLRSSMMLRAPGARSVSPLMDRFVAYVESPRRLGSLNRDAQPRLIAIDPTTGREHWSREIENVIDVLSDDRAVVVATNRGEMTAFRTADGAMLGNSKLPDRWVAEKDYRCGLGRFVRNRGEEGADEFGVFDPLTGEFIWRMKLAGQNLFDIVDGCRIAVLAADGQFLLIDGSTGREVFTTSLAPTPGAQTVRVITDFDHLYVVASSDSPIVGRTTSQARAFPAEGSIFALKRESGELLWKRSLSQMAFHREQPARWPFLVFASLKAQYLADRPSPPSSILSVQLIDRETGDVLYEGDLPANRDIPRGWKTDLGAKTILLRFGEATINVQFGETEQSQPPAAAPSEPVSEPEKPADDAPAPPEALRME